MSVFKNKFGCGYAALCYPWSKKGPFLTTDSSADDTD